MEVGFARVDLSTKQSVIRILTIHDDYFPSEVVTYEQWTQLKPEPKSIFSGWIKGAFHGAKKEMQESIQQSLDSVLSTAPMWDRLELKAGSKNARGKLLMNTSLPNPRKAENLGALRSPFMQVGA